MSDSRPWYADGIRFECTRCGKCCHSHGEYAYVYVDEPEVPRISAYLDLTPFEFRERYTERVDGWVTLRFEEGACPLRSEAEASSFLARRYGDCDRRRVSYPLRIEIVGATKPGAARAGRSSGRE